MPYSAAMLQGTLNSDLPVEALAERYRAARRLLITDILTPSCADALYSVLAEGTVWSLVHNQGGGRVAVLSGADLARLTAQEKARRLQDVLDRARNGFSFLYRAYLMSDRYLKGDDPGHPLHGMLAFINSPPFLALVRQVTGITSIVKADAQATLYGPGDFLTTHDDNIAAAKRRVAYVLGMSRDWKADWGGLTQFFAKDGSIEQVFVPRFNSLLLFSVPQDHAVTPLASYAPMARYSITGWFIDP